MNELERYLFDLQGFLVVENALTASEITARNELLDQQIAKVDESGKACFRFDSLLSWGSPFRSLIDNPRITPYLTDVNHNEGGFGCIPGSHKSNLPLPDEWRDLEKPLACVQAIALKAGTAIIFTEALTHGTLPWTGQHERRTLFYKYSPHPSAWARYYYNLDDYPDLTEAQRQILKTPGVYPR